MEINRRLPHYSLDPRGRAPMASTSLDPRGQAPMASASLHPRGRPPMASSSLDPRGRAPMAFHSQPISIRASTSHEEDDDTVMDTVYRVNV
jgi:hypothetical protein